MRPIPEAKKREVIRLLNDGLSERAIAARVDVSNGTVNKIVQSFLPSHSKPKAGRPALLTSREKTFCVHKITRGRKENAVQVSLSLEEELGVRASPSTVRRALKEAGLCATEKPKKPLLSEANRRKRLAFAKRHQHWTIDDWRRVVWSDETKINRFCSDGRKWAWIRDGEQIQAKHVKLTVKHGGGNIKVWSCITYDGVGWLTQIEDTMDSLLYREILQDELTRTLEEYHLDPGSVIFQHDNDPKHTSKLVREWLDGQEFETMIWPPQSPDLNPIEHMWAWLKGRLNEYETAPKGIKELFDRVGQTWYGFTKEECRKVINTMPERCQAVIKAKGGWTDY